MDFKRDLREESFRDLSKDLAAFANADGGIILVGVDNDGGVLGVDWNQEKSARVQSEGAKCNPKIQPSISTVTVPRKGTVVVIEVPKSASIHQDVNQRFPLRIGDSTMSMDAALFLTVAKSKGMIGTEGLNVRAVDEPKRSPSQVSFLTKQLKSLDPFIRTEATTDLSNIAYVYAVEDLSDIDRTLADLLKDTDTNVRMNTLNAIANMGYRMNARRKKKFLANLNQEIQTAALHDSDPSIRGRAFTLLCELGTPEAIDISLQLIVKEPEETFAKLNLMAGFGRMIEHGMGVEARRRFYDEVSKARSQETQRRLRQAMEVLRNAYWARPV